MGARILTKKERDKLKTIAKECRNKRLEYGYTQKEMADAIKVSPQLISAFECGRANSALLYRSYIELFGA